ncbi:glycosyltransferase [Polaribacter sp.]|nr:glycosyltransferase [Polaribacter sp.]
MVVFLGPIFTDEILFKHTKTSPAASIWCSFFAKNLDKKTEVFCLSAVNSSMFPIGALFVNGYEYNNPVETKMVSYLGLPYLRTYLKNKKIKKILNLYLKKGNLSHVITYNTSPQNIIAAEFLKSKGVKWVSIYADADTDKQLISNADYHLYFSYSSFLRSKYKNKINYEGSIYKDLPSNFKENHNKIFLYTGAIRKENGVELMMDAFKLIEDKNAKLIICGSGSYDGFIKKTNSDSRIKFLGLVDKNKLNSLYTEASFYLNPRLSCYEENNNNFPSKLLDYLSYGKPIISTKTGGINPCFYPYLFLLDKENKHDLCSLMNDVLLKTSEDKKDLFNKIKEFSENSNSWDSKVTQIWNWINI